MIAPKYLTYFLTALVFTACQSQSQIDSNFLGSTQPTIYANQTDNASNQFAGGTSTGTVWDSPNGYLRLDHAGAATDLELAPSWTPAWSHVVGYWKLNESNGNVLDSSGNENTGTPSAGVTLGVAGVQKTAASFNGTSGYIDLGNPLALQITGNITLQAWFKTTLSADNNFRVINKSKDNFSSTLTSYALNFDPQQANFQFWLNIGGVQYRAASCSMGCHNYADGYWHHWVGTYDGSSLNEYMDGKLIATTPASGNIVNGPENFSIGATAIDNDNFFQGSIDDVAVWNTSLSASAVSTIYQHESAKYAGTFTSRVMDGLSASANWTNFSWIPTLPFLKELPDSTNPANPGSETQTNYSLQSPTLMERIEGLWHFDEPSWSGIPGEVKDSSGKSNSGEAYFGASITSAGGKFGGAGYFDNTASAGESVIIPNSLNPWAGDFTISIWVDPFFSSSFEEVVAINEIYNTNGFRMGLNGISPNQAWTFWTVESGGSLFCSATFPVWDQWTHLTATYQYLSSTLTLYVNGVYALSCNGTVIPPSGGLQFGAGSAQYFTGFLDEAAVWSRALSATEVKETYRRGANRIRYQVRTCNDATCGTNPTWQGPDNTDESYFSELNNTTLGTSGSVQASLPNILFQNFLNLFVPSHQYFQYRAVLESDDTSIQCNYGSGPTWCSPELKSISAGPLHQK